jgi:hypothetical protein
MSTLNAQWHKPSRSGSNGQCVEARYHADTIEVRNSNHPDDGIVCFTRVEWQTFITAVASDGEFRLP